MTSPYRDELIAELAELMQGTHVSRLTTGDIAMLVEVIRNARLRTADAPPNTRRLRVVR